MESLSMRLEEYFKKEIINGEIKNHWKKLLGAKDEHAPIYLDKKLFPPWFGDLPQDLHELKKEMSDIAAVSFDATYELFPKSIKDKVNDEDNNNLHNLSWEIGYLLPQTPKIEKFLPVLVISYLYNRRPNSKFVYELSEGTLKSDFNFQKPLYWFYMQSLEDRHQKLFENPGKKISCERVLPIYQKVVFSLVLTKLLERKNHINVGLSFYVFEQMSGYFSLLGTRVCNLLERLNNLCLEEILEGNTDLNKEILSFVNSFLSTSNDENGDEETLKLLREKPDEWEKRDKENQSILNQFTDDSADERVDNPISTPYFSWDFFLFKGNLERRLKIREEKKYGLEVLNNGSIEEITLFLMKGKIL